MAALYVSTGLACFSRGKVELLSLLRNDFALQVDTIKLTNKP